MRADAPRCPTTQEINGQRKTELPVCNGVEDSVKIAKALIANDPELERFASELCNNDAFFSDQVAKMLETTSQLGCENLVPISGSALAGQPASASSTSGKDFSPLSSTHTHMYINIRVCVRLLWPSDEMYQKVYKEPKSLLPLTRATRRFLLAPWRYLPWLHTIGDARGYGNSCGEEPRRKI